MSMKGRSARGRLHASSTRHATRARITGAGVLAGEPKRTQPSRRSNGTEHRNKSKRTQAWRSFQRNPSAVEIQTNPSAAASERTQLPAEFRTNPGGVETNRTQAATEKAVRGSSECGIQTNPSAAYYAGVGTRAVHLDQASRARQDPAGREGRTNPGRGGGRAHAPHEWRTNPTMLAAPCLTGSSRSPTRRRRPGGAPGAAGSRPATRGRIRDRARGRRRPWR
jgi:hypothetical protein